MLEAAIVLTCAGPKKT